MPGLTLAGYSFKKSYRVAGERKLGSSRTCAWLEGLEVDFSYDTLEVYLSKEYPEGTCEHFQLRRHELDHVDVHRRLHAAYAERLKAALAGAPGLPTKANPAAVEDQQAAERLADKVIQQVTGPLFQAFDEELKAEQARLDTPEAYRVLQSLCGGWRD